MTMMPDGITEWQDKTADGRERRYPYLIWMVLGMLRRFFDVHTFVGGALIALVVPC